MIEIRVDDNEDHSNIGEFQPKNVEIILELLRKYGTLTKNGDVGEVTGIVYDVGFSPHIWVSCTYPKQEGK